MIGVILADDHEMFREGLRAKFREHRDISVLAEASSMVELHWKLRSFVPDVVVLDLKLSDGNSLAAIPSIRAAHPRCQVVVLTMFDHSRYAQYATASGALGFVVKGSPFEELAKAVREAAQGLPYRSPSLERPRGTQRRQPLPPSPVDTLSHREFEVLTLLSSGSTLTDAARQMGVAVNTVATYRDRLMEKMGLANKTDLVRVAIELGLVN